MMTKKERVLTTLRGENSDRPPVCFWQHFGALEPEQTVAAHVKFFEESNEDILKMMCDEFFEYPLQGAKTPADFLALRPLGRDSYYVRGQIERATQINEALKGEVFSLYNAFSPYASLKHTDAPSGALQQAPTFVFAENGRLALHMYTILPVTANAEALMASAQAAASAAGAQAELIHLRNACYFPADHPVVAALTATYREVTGFDGDPFVMTGGNYAAILPNAFGFGPGMPGREFPAHIFKPGHGDYHQCDESEDVEHILNFMRVYAMGIITLEEMASEVILQA